MAISERIVKTFGFFVYETTRYISPMAIAIEWVFVAIAVLAIFMVPCALAPAVSGVYRVFRWIAARRSMAVLVAGLLPVVVRLMMLPVAGYPKPSIHDEFSHLLLSDTLVTGRLTNPTHSMWRHFESIHIIQRPTYNSMYPPGQALFLAFGQFLFHHPWFGVVTSIGLMGMAVCWMLQGYLSDLWALYGSVILALKIGIVGFWMNSYMGGAPGAIGGALVVGSLPRLSEQVTPIRSVLLSLGFFLLLNSRPFEGGILSAAVLLLLIFRLRPRWRNSWRSMIAPALPGFVVLLLGMGFTGYYCFRVTGSPFRMPYSVNRATYGWPENLAVLPPKQLHLDHPLLEAMYEKEIDHHRTYSTPGLILDSLDTRFFNAWVFFVGPVLTPALLLLPWAVRQSNHRVLAFLFGLEVLINLFQLLLYPQHLAHVTGVIFALLIVGLSFLYRRISTVSLTRARYMAVSVPILLVLVGLLKFFAQPLHVPVSYWERTYELHRDARFAIEESLSKQPGRQLVIVRYSPLHSPDQEWVYNRADIDRSAVVWARDMGPKANRELVEYFHDRSVWLLDVDKSPVTPVLYESSSETSPLKNTQITN